MLALMPNCSVYTTYEMQPAKSAPSTIIATCDTVCLIDPSTVGMPKDPRLYGTWVCRDNIWRSEGPDGYWKGTMTFDSLRFQESDLVVAAPLCRRARLWHTYHCGGWYVKRRDSSHVEVVSVLRRAENSYLVDSTFSLASPLCCKCAGPFQNTTEFEFIDANSIRMIGVHDADVVGSGDRYYVRSSCW